MRCSLGRVLQFLQCLLWSDVSWAMVMWPPMREVTQWHRTEQTRTNMSARSATVVVDCLMMCLMTVSWLFHDCLMTIACLSHDCFMTDSWRKRNYLGFGMQWVGAVSTVGPCFFVVAYFDPFWIKNTLIFGGFIGIHTKLRLNFIYFENFRLSYVYTF